MFIGLQTVEAADHYDVQVRPFEQKWADPFKATTKTSELRLRLTPGHYAIRTRSGDAHRNSGAWGQWKDFWIHFKPPTEVVPHEDATISPMGSSLEKISFEWPRVKLAPYYLFQLRDSDGKVLENAVTAQTWFVSQVAVSKSYTWSVIPLSSRKDLDSEELVREKVWHGFKVDAPNETLRQVYFQIGATKNVKLYQFEFVKFIKENEAGEPSVQESHTPDARIRLKPGVYEVRVRNVFEDDSKSDWSSPEKFFVAIPPPDLLTPINHKVVESTDDLKSKVTLKWKSIPEADHFRVRVFSKDGSLAADVTTKDTALDVFLPHDTDYKWEVVAFNRDEPSREPASVTPNAATAEFSINSYIKLELAKSEEPSQLYAWSRYQASMIGYEADNFDHGTRLRQSVFGGTGELAVGYWHRKTNYGVLVAGSMSGFTIGSQTYTYKNGSLLAGRRFKLSGSKRVRVWAGLTHQETPEIESDITATQISFDKISGWGPEVRASYNFDVTENLGMHLFAGGTYITSVGETPNGLGIQQAPIRYSFGIQGTKTLKNGWIGMLGYTYQAESASYGSFDAPNHFNSIQWSGHFLSLALQFGLEQAYR